MQGFFDKTICCNKLYSHGKNSVYSIQNTIHCQEKIGLSQLVMHEKSEETINFSYLNIYAPQQLHHG